MANVSVKAAKASFSELIDEAAAGECVTITREGMPAAVLVSVEVAEEAKRAMARPKQIFADLLLSCPGGIEVERDQTPCGISMFERLSAGYRRSVVPGAG